MNPREHPEGFDELAFYAGHSEFVARYPALAGAVTLRASRTPS